VDKNIAVVGCGYWGKNLVRNFYELNALAAICDLEETKLNAWEGKLQGVKNVKDINVLLEDPRIKGVVISTPAATHYSIAKQALLKGKDVLVEKPISLSYKEGYELVEVANSHGLILMVGHILNYHPAFKKIKELIDTGELGKINYIYSNRLNLGKFRIEENILWSFAPHDISIIIGLLNEMPDEISAHGGSYLNPNIADVTVTHLRFPSGVNAHIFVSWLHPYKEQRLVIIGDKKMIAFDDVSTSNKLMSYDHKIDWIDRLPVPHPEKAEPIPIDSFEPLRAECQDFLDCIITRKRPDSDGINGLKVLQILEICQDSLKNNGNVIRNRAPEPKKFFVHETAVLDDNVDIG
jgi:UDP-2-acetamido-3-amino-2,3-dideoxy-glucuronate N-acetyltransferase